MATIESKNLLVWVKAMSRGQALPLDASEIYDSYDAATAYAGTATAYAGQTIKALLEDGKYHSYVLQPSDAGYTLEEVGAVKAEDMKQYVQIVEKLPESGQEQGILYIVDTTGSIWTGTAWKTVFKDITADVTAVQDRVTDLETEIDTKAPVTNPIFEGKVMVGSDEVAVKSYVDGLIANITSCAPGIVGTDSPLPSSGYKAGQTFRVVDAGAYAGNKCEVGDLIIVVADYSADTASDNDFMVVQANVDGTVTSSADSSTVGEIVVFDAVTGKVIKGSGVSIDSLNNAISRAHEHTNKTILDSYDKTQAEVLEVAKTEAQGLIDTYKATVDVELAKKANVADLVDSYSKVETDALLAPITKNLNTKVDATTVDNKIAEAKTATLGESAIASSEALEERLGNIPADTTVQSYIDTAVGSGGTASATAIATAKQEAIDTSKAYTDAQLASALTIVEF